MTYKSFQMYLEEDARRLLRSVREGSTAYRARKFYDGDHLWSRQEWRGPVPDPEGLNPEDGWLKIERGFVSQNVVKEAVERHTFGVAGREPMWSYMAEGEVRRRAKTRSERKAEAAEALSPEDEIVLPWWDDFGLLLKIREAVTNLLLTGSGCLRLYFSPVEPRRILVTVPDPGQARVYRDPLTGREIGVYSFTADGKQFTEVCYLNDEGQTVVKTLAESAAGLVSNVKELFDKVLSAVGVRGEDVIPEAAYDLGGRLTIYEMSREPLIDDQFLQNQNLMNMGLTMLPLNVVSAGHLERIFIDIQRPKVQDAQGKDTDVDAPYVTGPGAATFATSRAYQDADGVWRMANGQVIFRNPIDVKIFEDTIRIAYEAMLGQCHQKHILDPGTGEFGAEARKQARDDYEKSLLMTKAEEDGLVRFAVETKLRMEAVLRSEEGRFNATRVSAEARIDIGPLNSEDKRMMQADVERGRLSLLTYLNRIGSDDPDAEVSLITASPTMEMLKSRLDLVKQARDLGFELEAALKLAGITDEKERSQLMSAFESQPPPDETTGGDAGLIA